MKFVIAGLIILILAVLGHVKERGRNSLKDYSRSIFLGNIESSKKSMYLDYARVIATLGVFMTHSCAYQRVFEDIDKWQVNVLSIGAGLGLVCNPLYMLISGALLLNRDYSGSLKKYYAGRIKKIVIPVAVTYAILMIGHGQIDTSSLLFIPELIKRIAAGAEFYVPHMVVMYIFVSLYITAPFIAKMVQNLSDKQINFLFGLILIEEFIAKYIAFSGGSFGITLDLASFQGIFILGYIVIYRRNKIMERFIVIAGAISVVFMSVMTVVDYNIAIYTFNEAPTSVLFAAMIMVLLSKREEKLKERPHLFLQVFAKYSLVMLLLHWDILYSVVIVKLNILPAMFYCFGIIVVLILMTILCLIAAIVYDNTVLISVRFLLSIRFKRKEKKKV